MLSGKDENYWTTPKSEYLRYESRKRRRVRLLLSDMPAVSKKQSRREVPEAFRSAIGNELAILGRRSFKSAIFLSLELETSGGQPASIQTLAKNYLDLLGRATHFTDKSNADRLLYGDDSQVHILSVSCRHGVENPMFSLEAGRLSDFIADLKYIEKLETEHPELDERDMAAEYHYDDALQHLRDAEKMSSEVLATSYGRATKILAETHSRRIVQEYLLNAGQLRLRELAQLYAPDADNPNPHPLLGELRQRRESWITQSPFRISLPALPSVGESKEFRKAVRDQMKSFRDMLAHLMQPLMMQVGLQVIVRPRHGANKGELFDLDNLVRTYLIPQLLDQFSPPSDFLHTVDLNNEAGDLPYLADMRQRRDALPKGVRIGVVRYEVFRLPPATAKSPDGYVAANLVDCTYGGQSIFGKIDNMVKKAKGLSSRR
jgi:hypothetical protein